MVRQGMAKYAQHGTRGSPSLPNRGQEICEKSKSELNDFGLKASMFIKDKKSPKVQIKKIMDFYNTI